MIESSLTSTTPATGVFRIGVGSGFAGDRYDPAELLAQHGHLDALVFECLAERTIALAHELLLAGRSEGFDVRIIDRFKGTIPHLLKTGGVAVTNAGAANPLGAARAAKESLKELQIDSIRIAAVTGDDVLGNLDFANSRVMGSDRSLNDFRDRIISANVYLGADPIVEALDEGADIVVTGRCADAALFLAPIAHHFGWDLSDLDLSAHGTLIGHLLECAGQLSGGYFADKSRKEVPDLWNLGFPFADVTNDGAATYSKLSGTGGLISRETVLEQLLYEIDDPYAYKTPNVTVDLSHVTVDELSSNQVRVCGARSAGLPKELKVSVGIRDGHLASGRIVYSGHGCIERAELAGEIVRERWSKIHGHSKDEIEIDLIGVNSTRRWWSQEASEPSEVVTRFSMRTNDKELAISFCDEIESLYTNGPSGGGGVVTSYKETVGIISTMISRENVDSKVTFI